MPSGKRDSGDSDDRWEASGHSWVHKVQNVLCTSAKMVAAAYGTYVVFGTHPRCKVEQEIIWDPRKEVKVLVCLTWGFQLLVL